MHIWISFEIERRKGWNERGEEMLGNREEEVERRKGGGYATKGKYI